MSKFYHHLRSLDSAIFYLLDPQLTPLLGRQTFLLSKYQGRRFLTGQDFCIKFDALDDFLKRQASYHFKS